MEYYNKNVNISLQETQDKNCFVISLQGLRGFKSQLLGLVRNCKIMLCRCSSLLGWAFLVLKRIVTGVDYWFHLYPRSNMIETGRNIGSMWNFPLCPALEFPTYLFVLGRFKWSFRFTLVIIKTQNLRCLRFQVQTLL